MKKSFGIICVIGMGLAFATDALAVWGEINLGTTTNPHHGGYINTELTNKIQKIRIQSWPRARALGLSIDIKDTHFNEVMTHFTALGHQIGFNVNNIGNSTLSVRIDMNHPEWVKHLINECYRYDGLEPDEMLRHMHARVDRVLATLRQRVPLLPENNTTPAQSTSASTASATSAHSASSASASSASSSSTSDGHHSIYFLGSSGTGIARRTFESIQRHLENDEKGHENLSALSQNSSSASSSAANMPNESSGWEEINDGHSSGGYRNKDPNKKLQRIDIIGVPLNGEFEVTVSVKKAYFNEFYIRNSIPLQRLGFRISLSHDSSPENQGLLFTIDMDKSDRVKDLINLLAGFETFEPRAIRTQMKAKVDQQLASMRRALGNSSSSSSSVSAAAAVQCYEQEMATDLGKTLSAMGIDDIKCAICLEKLEMNQVVAKLSCDCKLGYHGQCIDDWRKLKNTCPMCRKPSLRKDDIHFDYQKGH